eukprot:TRINITY_DN1586_c0_g1_i2.p1 TRINITY_DN1586_c0_g1~~TRINITY_DN1586_c0_g1_i2.p1  ORF type:complete len:297 (-),score=67.11 TRINITY_DN1586_c0_g1_i2:574-1464(-)
MGEFKENLKKTLGGFYYYLYSRQEDESHIVSERHKRLSKQHFQDIHLVLPEYVFLVFPHTSFDHRLISLSHESHPNLLLLSTTIGYHPSTEISKELHHGIVLDCSVEPCKLLCWSFPKIKGLIKEGQLDPSLIHTLNWKDAKIYEKVDGIHISMFHHLGKWCLVTKYDLDISRIQVGWKENEEEKEEAEKKEDQEKVDQNLEVMFWRIWKAHNYQLPTDTHCSYHFSLVSTRHRYCVNYQEEDVILISARNMLSLQDLDIKTVATSYGWNNAKEIEKPDTINTSRFHHYRSILQPF